MYVTRLISMNTASWPTWLRRVFLIMSLSGFLFGALRAAEPVGFVFKVFPSEQNPFAREIWAEIITPSQTNLKLPAFYVGKGRFSVRARAEEKGEYRLGAVTESIDGRSVPLDASVSGSSVKTVRKIEERSAIRLDPEQPSHFVFSSGNKFVPIGANLAWAPTSDRIGFYRKAFKAFSHANLNWARVWMAHWGGLNMEWLPEDMGKSPPPGTLDLRVANNWDKLLTLAGDTSVYLQVVLQHHGQYSSKVDTSWRDNPWNVANPGGFLMSPSDFFVSPEAIKLTRMKYRYVIARWGYSPSVLAWELFNEAHWSDAVRETHNDGAVALWHSQMAAFIRSIDHYGHLITTSMEDLQSPIYADMDYLQPHLYAPNLLAGVRRLGPAPATPLRPVFYGEAGDDHLPLSAEIKKTGIDIVPPVWASLTGQCPLPAQPWQGAQLMATGRLDELGAVARFLTATKLGQREGLVPFSPVVACADQIPLVLVGGQIWQERPAQEITVPLDGREILELANIPRIYVGAKESLDAGFSGQTTLHFDFPKPSTLSFHITETNSASGAIRISIDGVTSAERTWPERKPETLASSKPYTDVISVPILAGVHTVLVENPGSLGWFDLSQIDLGMDVPVLAATGQRDANFIAVWVWHRNGVFTPQATPPAQGTLMIGDVAPGTWRVTWWNTLDGIPDAATNVSHNGGVLRIATPPISRHAAVVLTRETP